MSPLDPHWESLEKAPQPPAFDYPCYARMKKLPAVLKTLICSNDVGLHL